MSLAETVWSFGFLGLLLLGIFWFRRLRSRTDDFRQTRDVKQRISSSVAIFEKVALYALALLVGGLLFRTFAIFHKGQVTGATAVYVVLGCSLVAIPVAALGANGISWVVPPLRRANQAAMSGSQVSFASANRGLLLVATASVPIGLIAIIVAGLEPWAR
ncbi:hypothetical protein [Phenylobacterium aquaticum]|uniref:hypothetical protein n=1 Tax=Phenylobacterium aquaticum TaxID=1763816 RepID=UPI001F5DF56E|nr:hypothetical protein [Phenylobacterium aquaticum]MCI3133787.1 hypothetical protein [Phenylobacterium aquaticum]